jgi:glycogen operon protein
VKLIAEPWDVGDGGYQVGNFPPLWTEWNGKYRDTIRDFWRGQHATLPEFASRLTGSSDLYQQDSRRPVASVNFVTCHDGFTLTDLVSYDHKHNEANGEGNRDGADDNRSWNCGTEGPTDDRAINELRARQKRNFLATLFLSQGVPMLLAGDEMGRTQAGNNNAYCQDNETSWFDWSRLKKHADVHRFLQLLTARRLLRGTEHERQRISLNRLIEEAHKTWHGVRLNQPDWGDNSHSVALTVELKREKLLLHLILNAYWEPLEFELPSTQNGSRTPWQRWIDTALETPDDIVDWRQAPVISRSSYRAQAHSVAALYAVTQAGPQIKPVND